MRTTQEHRTLGHLQKFGTIDDTQARDMYGIRRIAAVIHKLREKGNEIETIDVTEDNRYGEPCTFARYHLKLKHNNFELAL